MITANEIRRKFLQFFKDNGHEVVSSSSLVPREDPSLLFTNAGMVQFKKVFLGQVKPGYSRATTSQKCLRVGGKHNDLDNVGRTARHHTFFEMLGNFSFGDYFKEEAIRLAWKFLTEELKLQQDRLYVTVFRDDDEARNLWLKLTPVPAERIFRMGEKDNFWTMGDTGPCGPCSEILFDQGEHMTCGPNCGIGQCDCDRFLEIWNLVFMQYDQSAEGRAPLPKPSIDTGMGLERIAAVCQGVHSNYDTDLFQSIIGFTAELGGVSYRSSPETDTALRVIADHSRAIAFMITDGILPSNEGRGYVLRRLIRRAYRFGRMIGFMDPFLYKTAHHVTAVMGDDYPELLEAADFMGRVVREEEERFNRTLDKGLGLLEEELEALGGKLLPGDVAFKLYDTFGFPLDIVNDIAEKRGVAVDEKGFTALMAEQKERAKAAWKGSGEKDIAGRFHALLEEGLRGEFIGYERCTAKSRVSALLDADGARVDSLEKGESGWLVSTQTPFYGASGGQAGDTGLLITPSGAGKIVDTLKPSPELTVHAVQVTEGELLADQEVDLTVEEGMRVASARNHTATHLLHAALRRVLGDHVKQAGSLVAPDRLRFDFTHIAPLTPGELRAVEQDVNRVIMADIPLSIENMSRNEALARGAMALFGEKYGDVVRVVAVPGESTELCGGTHLKGTGQAGLFLILSDTGIAAGVRRIEALTGWNALRFVTEQRTEAAAVATVLKSKPGDLAERAESLQKEIKALRKDLEKASGQRASGTGRDLAAEAREVNGVKLVAAKVDTPNVKALRELMDDLRSKVSSGVICLAMEEGGKVSLIVAVSKDLAERFPAPKLIGAAGPHIGGSGGGRPDMAQAGGGNPEGIEAAFKAVEEMLKG